MEDSVYQRSVTKEEYEERIICESMYHKNRIANLEEENCNLKKEKEHLELLHKIVDLHYGKVEGPFS